MRRGEARLGIWISRARVYKTTAAAGTRKTFRYRYHLNDLNLVGGPGELWPPIISGQVGVSTKYPVGILSHQVTILNQSIRRCFLFSYGLILIAQRSAAGYFAQPNPWSRRLSMPVCWAHTGESNSLNFKLQPWARCHIRRGAGTVNTRPAASSPQLELITRDKRPTIILPGKI